MRFKSTGQLHRNHQRIKTQPLYIDANSYTSCKLSYGGQYVLA